MLPAGYTSLRLLHTGHLADVYEVWSDERACRCIAKCLRPDRVDQPLSARRLLREGHLLRRLAHLHLARAYAVIAEPPTIILEVLTGKTLERRLEDQGALSVSETIAIGVQLCSVLHYLHYRPLLHLDLKPSNVVCERGLIKLLDLSIARPPGRIRRGVGTRLYLAPEQASGGIATAATDIWGLGAVLFEVLTGRGPFADTADGERYPQLVRRPARVGSLRVRTPRQLGCIIDASLAACPSDRPSLGEVVSALSSLAESATPGPTWPSR